MAHLITVSSCPRRPTLTRYIVVLMIDARGVITTRIRRLAISVCHTCIKRTHIVSGLPSKTTILLTA